MSTRIQNRIYDNSLDANFRSWGKEISDALLAQGWVKSADTGQIDWATIARPTVANTVQGFEIWRPGDALSPIFLKIEYGSGAANALHPGVWITLGNGTNGAGTLTGNVSARTQLSASGNTTGNVTIRSGGNASSFQIMLASEFNNGANMIAFSVERSYTPVTSPSPALTETDDYAVLSWITATQKQSQVVPKAGLGSVPAPRLFDSLCGDDGVTVRGVSPAYCFLYPFWGRACLPLRSFAAYMNAEMTGQDDDTADFYGVSLNYFRAGGTLNNIFGNGTPATNSRLAMRYD